MPARRGTIQINFLLLTTPSCHGLTPRRGPGKKGSGIIINYLCSCPKNGAAGNDRISSRIQMDDVTERGKL